MIQTDIVLRVDELSVNYRQNRKVIPVLDKLSFSIRSQETLALLGESGSGKSTAARAMMGLLPPSADIERGFMHLSGGISVDLSDQNTDWRNIRGKKLAMIYQDAQLALNPMKTIRDHFHETLRHHKIGGTEEIEAMSVDTLRSLGFENAEAERVLRSYPFQLSGGMCQRACIALALCLRPDILIADEPTSALDTVSRKEVLELLTGVQRMPGLSILLITHDIAVARAFSEQVIVLEKGRIAEQGQTRQVFKAPQSAGTRALVDSLDFVASGNAPSAPGTGNTILKIERLHKEYGNRIKAIDGLNIELHEREIMGILGQSGCGKSTLAKCIVGLEKPGEGHIRYRGKDLVHLNDGERREICRRIQMIFQDARASLNPGRTALQLVQEPLGYLRIGSPQERIAKARFYLEQVGIEQETQQRRPPRLSTGQCQRVAIARALVPEPEILICDEAVSALDMKVQAQILKLLYDLHRKFNFAILMISHDIRVVKNFCHTVAIMKNGCFCEVDSTEKILNESRHACTKNLLQSALYMETGV